MRNLKTNLLCSLILVAISLTGPNAQATGTQSPPVSSNRFSAGDIFVSLSNGTVQWRNPDGSLKQVLETGAGPAKNMAVDDAGNLYVPHWYNNGSTAGNNVVKLERTVTSLARATTMATVVRATTTAMVTRAMTMARVVRATTTAMVTREAKAKNTERPAGSPDVFGAIPPCLTTRRDLR